MGVHPGDESISKLLKLLVIGFHLFSDGIHFGFRPYLIGVLLGLVGLYIGIHSGQHFHYFFYFLNLAV
jgi:hypothetical protein